MDPHGNSEVEVIIIPVKFHTSIECPSRNTGLENKILKLDSVIHNLVSLLTILADKACLFSYINFLNEQKKYDGGNSKGEALD